MRILIACEFSGVVRDAFIRRGHDAWSCDLLETEIPGPHYRRTVEDVIAEGWDLMVAHPPCTHLCVSGARWFQDKQKEQQDAIRFFMALMGAPIDKICVENPVGIMSTVYRKPDQIVQPWQFGHGETKATCLWLKGLPLLSPTHRKGDFFCQPEPDAREHRVHMMPPGPERWRERSRTYRGIANAMAEQWG